MNLRRHYWKLCEISEIPNILFRRKLQGTGCSDFSTRVTSQEHFPPSRATRAKPTEENPRETDSNFYFSFRSKISPMRLGFALPLLSFITWPLRKFNAAALPALKSAAGPGLAAMA